MIFFRWILNTLILMLVANLTPGVSIESFWSALITSLVFGLINAIIRPIMLLLTLPINILSFGIFTLIINALMFCLVGTIVKGLSIDNFGSAFFAAFLYWLIIMVVNYIEKPKVKVVK